MHIKTDTKTLDNGDVTELKIFGEDLTRKHAINFIKKTLDSIISICKNHNFDNTNCQPVYCSQGKNWGLLIKQAF